MQSASEHALDDASGVQAALKATISNLQEQLAERDTREQGMQEQLGRLQSASGHASDDASGVIAALETTISSLTEQLADAKRTISSLQGERESAQLDMDVVKAQVQELETQLLDKQFDSAINEPDGLQQRAEALAQDLAASQVRVRELEDENRMLTAQASSYTSEQAATAEQLQRELETTAQEASRVADLSVKLDDMTAELAEARRTIEKLEEAKSMLSDGAGADAPASDNNLWGCEWNCGYKGASYDDVAEHEKTCKYRESNAEDQIARQRSITSDSQMREMEAFSHELAALQTRVRDLEDENELLKAQSGVECAESSIRNEPLPVAV